MRSKPADKSTVRKGIWDIIYAADDRLVWLKSSISSAKVTIVLLLILG